MKAIQYSIATLLILTALVALYLRPDDKSWTDSESFAITDANHRLIVRTGVRDNQLLFVAITGDPIHSTTSTNSIVRGGGSVGQNWHTIRYPDGSAEPLPKRGSQLFQFIDGQWSESPGDITPAEFVAFRASNPREFTMQRLVEFVGNMRREIGLGDRFGLSSFGIGNR